MKFFTQSSLSSRLLVASSLLLPVFLSVTGYFLDRAFQLSLEAAEQQRLQSTAYVLLGAAEISDQQLQLPDALSEPQLSQINSGLYGFILDADNREIWRSASVALTDSGDLQQALQQPQRQQLSESELTSFSESALTQQPVFIFQQRSLWESDDGREHPFHFYVIHTKDAFVATLKAYRKQLWQWLGAATLLLLLLQWMILRWGLRPLKKLARDLKAMEAGTLEQLSGEYPSEVQQVTDNLNRVLEREHQQRERYRNSLGDLAHSLKTPLAALRGGEESCNTVEELKSLVDNQVSRMDQIVSHQLQRAIARNVSLSPQRVNIGRIVERLQEALSKVYRHKQIQLDIAIDQQCYFNGDERDLMEVLGNLLENAFKYGNQRVALDARQQGQELMISIGDDGPGVAAPLQQEILQRGARADTVQPGQGIGLAMVVEILSGYKGSLSIGASSLGGAEFRLVFPG